jgi:hypothetical protein
MDEQNRGSDAMLEIRVALRSLWLLAWAAVGVVGMRLFYAAVLRGAVDPPSVETVELMKAHGIDWPL